MAAKSLILVENANKAKTLKKLLGSKYSILSTEGFLKAMPKSRLGVDEENDYTADYKTIRGKAEMLKKLRKSTLNAGRIFIATNPNFEGEFLANQFCQIFGINEQSRCRVCLYEFTGDAVKSAIKNARPINMNFVEAFEAKQIVDKIASHKIGLYFSYKIWVGNKVGRFRAMLLKIISQIQPAGTFEISKTLTIATLQELAARDLNFSASKTLLFSLQLYDGINLGDEGYIGLITFPYEEIKISSANRTPESVKEFLSENQFKLYELIYKAVNEGFSTKVELNGTNTNLALMIALDKLKLNWGEYFSIGMLSLMRREYITVEDSVYKITDLGRRILSELDGFFDESLSAEAYNNFFAKVYEIAEDNSKKILVIDDYCKVFNKDFRAAMASLPKGANVQKVPIAETNEICGKCGSKMILKHGRYGKFLACSNYPDCKNVKPYVEYMDKKCPKCGGRITKRIYTSTKASYGCENPDCDFKTWDDPLDKPCNTCGSTVFAHKFKGRAPMIYCGNKNCETRIDHPINKILERLKIRNEKFNTKS